MRKHLESRNPTLRCRDGRGQRVFVKASVRNDPGIAHERMVLGALRPIVDAPVPRVRHSTRGVLALEWVGGKTLWELRRTSRPHHGEAIGAALARVQINGRRAVSDYGVSGDLAQRLLWPSPGLYASLGPAALELFGEVQKSPALHALAALIDAERTVPLLLVHGDLRQPNIMVHRDKVTFLDWELSGLGDPARDLGMLLAEDVRAWVLPRDEEEVLTRDQLERHGRALLLGWETTAATLGYVPASAFRNRILGWTGEALLRAAFTMAHHEASCPPSLVKLGIALLEAPDQWSSLL